MLVLSRTTETRSCVGPTPNVAVCAPAYPLGTYGDKAKPPVESPDGFAAKSANDWPLPAAVVDHSPSTRSSHISSAMLVRDRRTSSAKGAFGRHDRQDSAGIRHLV